MLKKRVEKIREIIGEKEKSAILLSTAENMRYVTGFTGGEGFCLVTEDKTVLLVDGRYTIQARQECKNTEVIEFLKKPFDLLLDYDIKNLMLEDKTMPLCSYRKLKETLKGTNFHNGSDVMDTVRSVKDEAEIKSIKKASEITDGAFSHILKFIKKGVTEKEIALELEFFMRKSGATGNSFPPIVAFGERSVLPHAEPTDRKLFENEAVLMDYGCVYDGYCSDMTRTVFFGQADCEFKKIYNLVLSAQKNASDNIRAGISGREADAFARDMFEKEGAGKYFVHSLGHGVGLEIHEAPNLSPRSELVLEKNNVVTIEPGLYIPDKFGVRIEDTVIVGENGVESLNKSQKELIEI